MNTRVGIEFGPGRGSNTLDGKRLLSFFVLRPALVAGYKITCAKSKHEWAIPDPTHSDAFYVQLKRYAAHGPLIAKPRLVGDVVIEENPSPAVPRIIESAEEKKPTRAPDERSASIVCCAYLAALMGTPPSATGGISAAPFSAHPPQELERDLKGLDGKKRRRRKPKGSATAPDPSSRAASPPLATSTEALRAIFAQVVALMGSKSAALEAMWALFFITMSVTSILICHRPPIRHHPQHHSPILAADTPALPAPGPNAPTPCSPPGGSLLPVTTSGADTHTAWLAGVSLVPAVPLSPPSPSHHFPQPRPPKAERRRPEWLPTPAEAARNPVLRCLAVLCEGMADLSDGMAALSNGMIASFEQISFLTTQVFFETTHPSGLFSTPIPAKQLTIDPGDHRFRLVVPAPLLASSQRVGASLFAGDIDVALYSGGGMGADAKSSSSGSRAPRVHSAMAYPVALSASRSLVGEPAMALACSGQPPHPPPPRDFGL
ncbi:hypothetical protein PAPYR_8336 [Paratrimastix pyriformis]|uniref:Uncharacterized protein n=1 Tax=Paratrimastix pyriformis TaxID=342808 RepID=A0ABQ8UEZ4_9EUKA|nr:hypothetical protein PAPYR_8336 [Paratrimastix pyriformis]